MVFKPTWLNKLLFFKLTGLCRERVLAKRARELFMLFSIIFNLFSLGLICFFSLSYFVYARYYFTHNISTFYLLASQKSGLYTIVILLTLQDSGEFMGRALKLLKEKLKIPRSQKLTIANIGVVIPTLNEEKNIEDVLLDLKKHGYQNILVIDGLSKDKTTSIATRNGVKVLLQNGRGKGTAIRQALNNGHLDADAVVMMDADGSMDPKEIGSLVEALNNGADIVKGSRFINGGYSYDMNSLRRFGNMFMVAIVNLLWSAKYSDLCYGFAAFNRQAIKKLMPHLRSKSFEIETEIFLEALNLGLVVKEVPSTEFTRKNGKSNLNSFRDGFKILMKIAEEFISSFPKKKVKAVST
jgi:hypothetical protein